MAACSAADPKPMLGAEFFDRDSIELARELIGYEPRVPLRDGLRETVAWYLRSAAATHGR